MSENPYAPERDYWDELPEDALEWMKRFTKATAYGSFDTLLDLCEEAPSDQFDKIKQEIMYERDFYKRNTMTLKHSRYSALDYGWSALYQESQAESEYEDFTQPIRKRRKK